jgi:hypothetical protein
MVKIQQLFTGTFFQHKSGLSKWLKSRPLIGFCARNRNRVPLPVRTPANKLQVPHYEHVETVTFCQSFCLPRALSAIACLLRAGTVVLNKLCQRDEENILTLIHDLFTALKTL